MSEDISRILNHSPGLAMNLLYKKDLVLSIHQKITLVDHWTKLGSPEQFRDSLIRVLGDKWQQFLNPFLVKLQEVPFFKLMVTTSDFVSLEAPEYKEIVKAIFDQKLDKLQLEVARSGYKVDIEKIKFSSTSQSLNFNLVSRVMPYQLYHFSASIQGYSYNPAIRLFNLPQDLTHLLTEQSVTNLKGIMFYMTENEDWDKSLLPRTLKFIKFKSTLLSNLSDSIVSKYYKEEMEESLRPKEDDDLGSIGSQGFSVLDEDDDDDDEDIYGSGFDLDKY